MNRLSRFEVPPVLKRFCFWVAGMTVLSELWAWAMSVFFHRHPFYGGTFSWIDSGEDLRIYGPRFLAFRTPHFWDPFDYPFTYPAPLAIAYWFLLKPPHAVQVYLALSILALVTWAWYFSGQLAVRGLPRGRTFALLIVFLAASWPVRFLLETGNLETLVACILGVGVLAAMKGRWRLAATLIGLAGSMKLYPLALLGVVLSQRRYREFAWGLGVAGLATLASLAVLGPSVLEAQRHIDEGLLFVKQQYIFAPVPAGLWFSHSLFNLVKIGVVVPDRMWHPLPSGEPGQLLRIVRQTTLMQSALYVYTPLVTVAALVLYFRRIRNLPLLNQVLALTICAVLLPPYSLDYTLVQLLVPFGLLCVFATDAWLRGHQPPRMAMCFACFAVIFTTGAYFDLNYGLEAQVRTLALLVLLAAVLRTPFDQRLDRPIDRPTEGAINGPIDAAGERV